jgi:hypothetical protein
VLGALKQLRRLEVLHIPCDDLSSLKQLTALTHLSFHQSEAVTAAQLAGIAACSSLRALDLHQVAWEDLPALKGMQGLQQLQLQLHTARHCARRTLDAGHALTALSGLTGLRGLSLHGPAAVTSSVLVTLGGSWQQLTSLELRCTLPEGTVGLAAFKGLKQLALAPYEWDCWSNEPPLLLCPASLPTTLTSLDAMDVWVAPDAPPSSAVTLPTPHLRRLVLRTLSPCERPLLLPDWGLAQQCEQLELSHSQLLSEHLHHIAALQARAMAAGAACRSRKCRDASASSSSSMGLKPCFDSTTSCSSGSSSRRVGGACGDLQLFKVHQGRDSSSECLEAVLDMGSSGGGSGAVAPTGVTPCIRRDSLVSTISRKDTVSSTVSTVNTCEEDAVDRRDSIVTVASTLSSSPTGTDMAALLEDLGRLPMSGSAAAGAHAQPVLTASHNEQPNGALPPPHGPSSSSSSRSASPEAPARNSPPRGSTSPVTGRACYSLVDMQQLRPLRLCSSPPQPQGLGHWRLLLSQWKHKLLLRVGATLSSWDGAHQGYSRGGWGPACSAFELLINGEEDEDLTWL